MTAPRSAGKFALPALALSQIAVSLMLLAPAAASAHGSMEEPISRIKYCHSSDNPENPKTPGCQAVKEIGKSQAIYDWNSVRQGDASSNHQQVVPNGQLCAGGNAKTFGGLDAAVDWPATTIQPGPDGKYTMTYHQTAQHQTAYFKSYISNDSYDFTRPLQWNDLQLIGNSGAVAPSEKTKLDVKIPAGMQGKRVIYNVWQRSDSGEAFYSCSDVNIVANSADFKPLGALVSSPFEAKPDSTISLRVFDKLRGGDLEKHSIKIAAGQTAAKDWTYALATAVNAKSSVVKVGQLQNGQVVPVKNATGNTVFGLGKEYSFALEQSDEGGKPPVDEIAPGKVTVKGQSSVNSGDMVSLSAQAAAGTNLKYRWTVSPSIAGLTLNAATLNFKAPEPKQDTSYNFTVKVSNALGSKNAEHKLEVKAKDEGGKPPVAGAWDAAKTYAQPCAKVTYQGEEWMNGWWTRGEKPGTGGQWGVWRPVSSTDMHDQCKAK